MLHQHKGCSISYDISFRPLCKAAAVCEISLNTLNHCSLYHSNNSVLNENKRSKSDSDTVQSYSVVASLFLYTLIAVNYRIERVHLIMSIMVSDTSD